MSELGETARLEWLSCKTVKRSHFCTEAAFQYVPGKLDVFKSEALGGLGLSFKGKPKGTTQFLEFPCFGIRPLYLVVLGSIIGVHVAEGSGSLGKTANLASSM